MYIPAANQIHDTEKAFDFIGTYGFATLVTQIDCVPYASHLPVLLDRKDGELGAVRGHMARANRQWQHFDPSKEVLAIFHGPHSYISPSWYVSKVAVPTWNYATVHVYGLPTVNCEAEFLREVVDSTTAKYEKDRQNPWKMTLPEGAIESLLKAIVGFTIRITRIETKFKLGQNRSMEDQDSMLDALEASDDPDSRALAAFIKRQK